VTRAGGLLRGLRRAPSSRALRRVSLMLAVVGPGLVTGIVDDDATGIAGYSVAGARLGYTLLWALLLSTVALAVVQEMAARMGAVTGRGLADLIRERFGVRISLLSMLTLLVANATTTVAEFAGVAGASEIFGIPRYVTVPIAAAAVFAIVVYGSYRRVERVLLLVSIVFVAYIVTGFVARPDWGAVAHGSLVPALHGDLPYLTILIGLIGTTITPWMQFYLQASIVDKGLDEDDLRVERWDVYVASGVTNLIAFFIIVTAGATLFVHDMPANTVSDVAQSLRPLAGPFAQGLFAIGLLNASVMAMAVLPLSTAYAVCEAFGWERSVDRPLREAPIFFGLFAGILIFGAVAVLVPGMPLLVLLFLPNVVGGVLLPVILVLMLILINDPRLMGRWVNSRRQNIVAWGTSWVLVVLTVVYLVVAVLGAAGVVRV
jgi:NRAMP (natural resistance-associated macrophage protein)-like metal ion transporter